MKQTEPGRLGPVLRYSAGLSRDSTELVEVKRRRQQRLDALGVLDVASGKWQVAGFIFFRSRIP
jgi:hypothetical protein